MFPEVTESSEAFFSSAAGPLATCHRLSDAVSWIFVSISVNIDKIYLRRIAYSLKRPLLWSVLRCFWNSCLSANFCPQPATGQAEPYSVCLSRIWRRRSSSPSKKCDSVQPIHWHRPGKNPVFSLWDELAFRKLQKDRGCCNYLLWGSSWLRFFTGAFPFVCFCFDSFNPAKGDSGSLEGSPAFCISLSSKEW